MTILFVLFCLLPTTLFAQTNDNAFAYVVRSRALSPEQDNARIAQFWTSERLKAAKAVSIVLQNVGSRSRLSNLTLATGPQISFAGSFPSTNGTTSGTISSNGRQIYTTGRVFWSVGSNIYSCSGAVVASSSGDLISTAGHCVFDPTAKVWYNNNNWIFVPAYTAGTAPLGVWAARQMFARNAWTNYTDKNSDVGFVALYTVNGQHIQSVVGSQGIGFNYPRLAYTYSLGYPINIYNGLYLQKCAGFAWRSNWIQDSYIGQGLRCAMEGGSSGGPWLQKVAGASGIGYVTSVNSFTISNVPNVMNGPYFGSNIASLYNSSKAA